MAVGLPAHLSVEVSQESESPTLSRNLYLEVNGKLGSRVSIKGRVLCFIVMAPRITNCH